MADTKKADATKDYSARIVSSTKELTVKEKLMFKDFSDAIGMDTIITAEAPTLVIKPSVIVTVAVHNEHAQDNKDYTTTVVVAEDGAKYTTSSESVRKAIEELSDELADAGEEITDYSLKFFKRESKNRVGKHFITCAIV